MHFGTRIGPMGLRVDSPALAAAEEEGRLARLREAAWSEARRWCKCAERALPGRSYRGERACERCGLVLSRRAG